MDSFQNFYVIFLLTKASWQAKPECTVIAYYKKKNKVAVIILPYTGSICQQFSLISFMDEINISTVELQRWSLEFIISFSKIYI
jgi:hypothetical protein